MKIISQAGNLSGTKVFVRNDFNITIENGKIIDDFRIRASLPTIKYLLEQKAKIILSSHFGRPLENQIRQLADKNQKYSLKPVAERLGEYLEKRVELLNDCIGGEVEARVGRLQDREIILLENLRFHPEEEANDTEFAKKLAALADIYVNDAFGASHRAHASIEKITEFLPSFAGLLLEKEVSVLSRILSAPEHPLVVIIGGAKISTKIKLIQEFWSRADNLLLGGALASTFLHAKGLAVGKSMIEDEVIPDLQKLDITNPALHIPVDVILSESKEGDKPSRIGPVGKIGAQELILDIGPETIGIFEKIIKKAKTVIWNGPMGYFETEKFSQGTKRIAEIIVACPGCFSVVGGGETTCLLGQMGLGDKFSHMSTGGGAMLEFLAGNKLPGIIALEK